MYFELFLFFFLPSYPYIISCHENYCVAVSSHHELKYMVAERKNSDKGVCDAYLKRIIDSQGLNRKLQIYFFMV